MPAQQGAVLLPVDAAWSGHRQRRGGRGLVARAIGRGLAASPADLKEVGNDVSGAHSSGGALDQTPNRREMRWLMSSDDIEPLGPSSVFTSVPLLPPPSCSSLTPCCSYQPSLASHFRRYDGRSSIPRCSQMIVSPVVSSTIVKSGDRHVP